MQKGLRIAVVADDELRPIAIAGRDRRPIGLEIRPHPGDDVGMVGDHVVLLPGVLVDVVQFVDGGRKWRRGAVENDSAWWC